MISIITPCKDVIAGRRASFFHKMIETLFSQTYSDFEHIVVDGASRDGTKGLLEKYQKEGKIHILISGPDQNVHEAMNKGIKIARGDVIHVMNSDNYFTSNTFFERNLEKLEQGYDFTHGDRSIETREGQFLGIKKGDIKTAYFRMPFRFQTMLIKRTVYNEIGPFDESYEIAGDLKFMLAMLKLGKKGFYFPEVFINSLDGGISSNREQCIEEVSRVLFESYGEESGLTLDECSMIYKREISNELYKKIQAQVKDETIRDSLELCYEISMAKK